MCGFLNPFTVSSKVPKTLKESLRILNKLFMDSINIFWMLFITVHENLLDVNRLLAEFLCMK